MHSSSVVFVYAPCALNADCKQAMVSEEERASRITSTEPRCIESSQWWIAAGMYCMADISPLKHYQTRVVLGQSPNSHKISYVTIDPRHRAFVPFSAVSRPRYRGISSRYEHKTHQRRSNSVVPRAHLALTINTMRHHTKPKRLS